MRAGRLESWPAMTPDDFDASRPRDPEIIGQKRWTIAAGVSTSNDGPWKNRVDVLLRDGGLFVSSARDGVGGSLRGRINVNRTSRGRAMPVKIPRGGSRLPFGSIGGHERGVLTYLSSIGLSRSPGRRREDRLPHTWRNLRVYRARQRTD